MSEDTTQPVVDGTKAPALPGAAVDGARNDGNDLDTLLAQFDQQTQPRVDPVSPPPATQQQDTPTPATQPDPLVASLYKRIEREDIGNLVKQVRGDLDATLWDNEIVEAWIDAQARKDPRLARAWLERVNNPQGFERIGKELGKKFAERASKVPDRQLTEDREAVAAAVRGASTQRAPESSPPNFGQMSNSDFRNEVRQKYGYDPG